MMPEGGAARGAWPRGADDHKARARAACLAACRTAVACRRAHACLQSRYDPLLGDLPAWWDYLPDGGEARRRALADQLGQAMLTHIERRPFTPPRPRR